MNYKTRYNCVIYHVFKSAVVGVFDGFWRRCGFAAQWSAFYYAFPVILLISRYLTHFPMGVCGCVCVLTYNVMVVVKLRWTTRVKLVWYGMVWYGMVWYGMVWYLIVFDR